MHDSETKYEKLCEVESEDVTVVLPPITRGEMSRNGIHIGQRYKMRHSRKGYAVVEIVAIEGEWIDVRVIEGHLQGMGAGSYRGPGDEERVRESLASFTPVG